MTPELSAVRKMLYTYKDPKRAEASKRYFKTGPGGYAAGDQFIGVKMPMIRKVAACYRDLSLVEIADLLKARIHEERQLALILLVNRFKKGGAEVKKAIFDFYMTHLSSINNWDLVDVSAPSIVGGYLYENRGSLLHKLAQSETMWHRRIAMVATLYFIRQGHYAQTMEIATLLRNDREDLIQKAVGWMLREVGIRDIAVAKAFLDLHGAHLPRTMLRYAIERFDATDRAYYMGMKARYQTRK